MFCPKCGANNTDDATFCASCGASLKADSASSPSPASALLKSGSPMSAPSMGSINGVFQEAIALVKDPKAYMTARADSAPPVMDTLTKYVAILACSFLSSSRYSATLSSPGLSAMQSWLG